MLHGHLHSITLDEVVRRAVAVCPGVLGSLYLDELLVGQLMNGPDALSRLIFQVFAVLFAVERWVGGLIRGVQTQFGVVLRLPA